MTENGRAKQRRRAIGGLLETARQSLERLVSVNSFTRNREGVNRNGLLVAQLFEPLGFAPSFVPAGDPDLGDHLVLTRPGCTDVEVLLLSHLDTVYPPEEEHRNSFVWRTEGDTVFGPGVADIKGGTVVAHLALAGLARSDRRLLDAITWRVAFNAAEEEGSADFPSLARSLVTAETRACLVFEHGNDGAGGATVVTSSRRGSARFLMSASGRPAHAGSAHARGASAIRELARKIEAIESMTAEDRSVTFNVGRVSGGTGSNTVPACARCEIDLRADDPHSYAEAMERVERFAGEGEIRSRDDGFPCTVSVVRKPSYPPWPRNEGSRRLVHLARDAGRLAGLEVADEHRLGASDGSHLWDLVPTLDGLGPVGRDIHSAEHDPARGARQESIRWSSMAERALLAASLMARIAEAGDSS